MSGDDDSARSACPTETQCAASPHTAGASLSRGKKRAQRDIDFLIAAAAATVILYLALLCHRTLHLRKTSATRQLAAEGSDDHCAPKYDDEEFPYYNDDFESFKPEFPLPNEHEVVRGPPRRGNLLSNCYRHAHLIPGLTFVLTGNSSAPGGRGPIGYATETFLDHYASCRDLRFLQWCSGSLILPADAEDSHFTEPLGCYPSYKTVAGYAHSDEARHPETEPRQLSCPLYSTRKFCWNFRPGAGKWERTSEREWNCFSTKTCKSSEKEVIVTADASDRIEVVSREGRVVYSADGLGLFKVECRTEMQIITQLAAQDLNKRLKVINDIIRLRYKVPTDTFARSVLNVVYETIPKLNEEMTDLFRARRISASADALVEAWGPPQHNLTANVELIRTISALKRTTKRLRQEAKYLLLKERAVERERYALEKLRARHPEKHGNYSFGELMNLINEAAYWCNEAEGLNGRLLMLLSRRDPEEQQYEDENRLISVPISPLEDAILQRRVAGLRAKWLIDVADKNIAGDDPQLDDVRGTLQHAKSILQNAEGHANVSQLLEETELIINPQCAPPTPTPLPLLGLMAPLLIVVLIVTLMFLFWRKRRIPVPRASLRPKSLRKSRSRSEPSDKCELVETVSKRVLPELPSFVNPEAVKE